MAEQSKKPEKTNATVQKHLTLVSGLGTNGLFMAYMDSFASPGDRVFVDSRMVECMGITDVLLILYLENGMRQAFTQDILKDMVILDSGVNLLDLPVKVLDEEEPPNQEEKSPDVVWKFYLDCGRMGTLQGVFVATQDELEALVGTDIYYGEVLGKYSDIQEPFYMAQVTKVTDDQDFVKKFREFDLSTGYNPLDYVEDEEDDE